MKSLIKPPVLSAGDQVVTVSLSAGLAGEFPYRWEIGKQRLEEIFGLKVIPAPNSMQSAKWTYDNPKARADDLMNAFLDPDIKAIFSNIGGYECIRLLPWIDFEVIRKIPKS